MLEISRIGDEEKFYIDFAYHGIPRDLNIEKIVVKSKYDEIDKRRKLQSESIEEEKEEGEKEESEESERSY